VRDAAALARSLGAARARKGGWVRGVGYHESVAGDLDRRALDRLRGDVPLRVQHRSGACWILNSAGVAALGLDRGADAPGVERDASGRATGRLFRLDAWLGERVPRERPDLGAVGARLAACGVTGVTDATAHNGKAELEALEAALASGALPQRLVAMGSDFLPEPSHPRAARGAVKLVLDEGGLPALESLARAIAAAHASGRAAAVHCATRAELAFACAAFREAGGARAGDRIEHASVAPPELVALVASMPLAVVTQPGFVPERGDAYLRDVEAADRPWLYRGRGWIDAGVPLAAGTDAPFGDLDPWRAIRAAVERHTASGTALGAPESLSPERALALFTTASEAPGGAPRRVRPGALADLCLLDRPWSAARRALASEHVAATWVGAELVFCREAG
jgi:predicted amidohydrolase YtcJ